MIVSPDYRIGWTIARPGAAGKRYLVSVASKAIPLRISTRIPQLN
jgi:hypothetical protein